MKKTIAVLSALISTAVFAVGGDLLISFSTPGPDKYADGTEVQAGECYSLVYTKADGTQDVVINYQTRYAGRCSRVIYVVDEATAGKYKDGTWGVYVLDTRDFNNDGKPAGLDNNGQPKIKNVQAPVVAAVATSDDNFATAKAKDGVSAGAYDLSDVPQPKIEGIRVANGKVTVTVSNTRPFVGYALVYGNDMTKFSAPPPTGTNGDVSTDAVIELVVDQKEGKFFKVSTVE